MESSRFDRGTPASEGVAASPSAVRAALEHMLASAAFGRAERPAKFLRHLVEATLDGQTSGLKESALGCDVFGRTADWDPRLDPVVRQEAARLRKRVAKYYESAGDGQAVRIVLPVGSYVPRFEAVAEPEVREEAAAPVARRRWVWPAAVVLLMLVAIGLWIWQRSRQAGKTSVAILPFQNVTSDPADQYFADSVTDELNDLVGRYAGVRTYSRAETAQYNADAKRLGAKYLVHGSVERAGDLITIVASLVDGANGTALWTNKYRRHGADLTSIEEDLASNVADTLHLGLARAPQKREPVAAAHDLLVKGRFEASQTTAEANSRAQADFRQALKLDPTYVLAYHGLAQAIWNENIWAGTSPLLSERRKSEELWRKAHELDAQFVPALTGLAAYAMQYDWDWARAERELTAAAAAGDNAGVEQNLGLLNLIRGQIAKADAHMQRAKLLDPDGLGRLANAVNIFMLEGRLTDAQASCEEWMKRRPDAPGPRLAMAGILAQRGQSDAALKILDALPKDTASLQIVLAQVKAIAGKRDEALRILAALEPNYSAGRLFADDFAIAYAELNDAPRAAVWMRRSMDAREGPAMYIRVDPQLRSVQDTPGFHALKKEMDLDW